LFTVYGCARLNLTACVVFHVQIFIVSYRIVIFGAHHSRLVLLSWWLCRVL